MISRVTTDMTCKVRHKEVKVLTHNHTEKTLVGQAYTVFGTGTRNTGWLACPGTASCRVHLFFLRPPTKPKCTAIMISLKDESKMCEACNFQ